MKIRSRYICILLATLMVVGWSFSGCKVEEVYPDHDYVEAGIPHTFENPDENTSRFDYVWDFGDGNSSTETSPTHTYTRDGVYTVNVSRYRKNGKFHSTEVFYIAMVQKAYRPVVYGVEIDGVDYYDYLFPGKEYYLQFVLSEEQSDNRSDYTFLLETSDGASYDDPYSNIHTFSDTGYYTLHYTITDQNGISGTLDTTVFVGADSTSLSIEVPETQNASIGTIAERYVLIFDNQFDLDDVISDVEDYPNDGNPFVQNGQVYHNYGSFFAYADEFELNLDAFPDITNGDTIYTKAPSLDSPGSTIEHDELFVVVVQIGDAGKSMGYKTLNVIPGSKVSTTIPLNFYPY